MKERRPRGGRKTIQKMKMDRHGEEIDSCHSSVPGAFKIALHEKQKRKVEEDLASVES